MAFVFKPRGDFSLAAASEFADGFPGTEAERPDGGLRFSWAVDDEWSTVTATVRRPRELVQATVEGKISTKLARLARRDLERILSLDVDGDGFKALGRRDPVVGALQLRFPGLRPVLFYTPYEAAAWAIIGHRIRMTQAATVKQRMAAELGVGGAFPGPKRLVQVSAPQPGLTDRKIEQLRELATAAAEGRLGRDRLRGMATEEAIADLEELPGIGPFSAELIMIRGVGDPDTFPRHEQRVARAVRLAYGLGGNADIEPIAEKWRPYRAWVALLLRSWLESETGEIKSGWQKGSSPRPLTD